MNSFVPTCPAPDAIFDVRARAELIELRAQNARLRALQENAFEIGLLLDKTGNLKWISPGASRVLGAQFEPGVAWWDAVHPADLPALQRDFDAALKSVQTVETRARLRGADGMWIALEARVCDKTGDPDVNALVFNARDVSRCSEARDALRQSEAELDSIIDAAPIFVFRWNRAGVYTFARGNFNTVLGVSPQDRVGRSVYELFAHKPELARNFERALAGETFQTTVHFGDNPFDAHYSPAYDQEGQVVGVIGATMDVSTLYAAERALAKARVQSEVEAAQNEVLDRLARAGEFRDDDTGQHTRRVGDMAAQLAARCGFSDKQVEIMRRAAPLHDIGKIGVPDSILLKPAKLTPEEFAVIKTHCEIGARLLSDGKSELVQMAQIIALSHHERFDGHGYPNKLRGEQIPIEGRIVAVVDVYDALTSERPYKAAWPIEKALAEISNSAGTQFDPDVVAAFLAMFE